MKRISLKELWEKVLILEGKMDAKTENDIIVAKQFKHFVFIIISVEVLGTIINYFIHR